MALTDKEEARIRGIVRDELVRLGLVSQTTMELAEHATEANRATTTTWGGTAQHERGE